MSNSLASQRQAIVGLKHRIPVIMPMKATIRDSSVLMSLGPLTVATYLRSKNWQVEVIGDKGSVWTLRSDDGQGLRFSCHSIES